MRVRRWIASPRTHLDVAAGMADGILTVLVLASGRLVKAGGGPSFGLVLKIGTTTALTTLFVFFVAHYAELRAEIARAEKELNLLTHGKLASGRLGRLALEESCAGSMIAAICGLTGALVPLLICFIFPSPPWSGIVAAIGLLGILGAILARRFHGDVWFWALALMVGGAVLAWIGVQLNVTG